MSGPRAQRPWGRIAAMTAVAAAGFALYFWGATNSPVLNSTLAAQKAFVAGVIRSNVTDPAREKALADAYLNRNPDVAQDAYFGRHGKLGLAGARAHYERYGKAEGRKWGLGK